VRQPRLWGSEWMIEHERKKENSTECSVWAAYSLRVTKKRWAHICLYIKRTTDQSTPAPPCPAIGMQLRPIKLLGEPQLGSWDGFSSSSLQQRIGPESQVWFRGNIVGTATTAETNITKERNLEYIVVVLRETKKRMKGFKKLKLRNFHPWDEA